MGLLHALAGHDVRDRKRHAQRVRVVPVLSSLEDRALLSTMDADLVTTASVNGMAVTSPYVTNARSVAIQFSATDPDDSPVSGLTTHFSVNGGAFTTGNTLTLTNEGTDTVQYFSTDSDGDIEAAKTLSVLIDRTAPVVTITSVSPSTLWPPNGKMVPVTVTGTVSDNLSGVNSPLTVHVFNEPGYQGGITLPSSPVMVQPTATNPQTGAAIAGTFDFTIMLQARRNGFDFDGRQYTIVVGATDAAGNSSTTTAVVTVPHDQGHHNGGQPGHGHGHGHGHGQGAGDNGSGDGNSQGQNTGNSHGRGHGSEGEHGNGNGHGKGHGQGG